MHTVSVPNEEFMRDVAQRRTPENLVASHVVLPANECSPLLADVAAEIAKGSLAATDVLGPRNEA